MREEELKSQSWRCLCSSGVGRWRFEVGDYNGAN